MLGPTKSGRLDESELHDAFGCCEAGEVSVVEYLLKKWSNAMLHPTSERAAGGTT